MIELTNVSAGYRRNAVLHDVTIAFRPGEVTAILGPNGCGKSTLLRAALGLLPCITGQVAYDGVDIRRMKRREIARQAAFLTQSRSAPSIQALRMVLHGRFPYLSYPRRYGKRDYEAARLAMEATGCASYESALVSELSGGQRQSVYLAMALAQDTQTVFMDEPTTFLDIGRQLQTMQTARALARDGKAVVLVLHDLPLALRGADRVAVFSEGSLAGCGAPEEIYASGVLDRVFGVTLHAADTPHGRQYYCTPKED